MKDSRKLEPDVSCLRFSNFNFDHSSYFVCIRTSHRMPSFSIANAQKFAAEGKYGPAVANYMYILKLHSELRSKLAQEFFDALILFSGELKSSGHIENAKQYFMLAKELYPNSSKLCNEYGQFLFSVGEVDHACVSFFRALQLDSSNAMARTNLTNLSSHFLDQWHFRMLNDRRRNQAYKVAIARLIQQGFNEDGSAVILDIGAGTGLLSMLAAQEAPSNKRIQIFACEQFATLSDVSRHVIDANKMENCIHVVQKHSSQVQIGSDLPAKASLIVTEIMDAGFYGEGIVPTLLDAHQRLLDPNAGKIIPSKAKLFAVAIESPDIRKNHVHRSERENSGFVVVSDVCLISGMPQQEPYYSEKLQNLPHGYQCLSEPVLIDQIDLNIKADLQCRHDGTKESKIITIAKDGQLDAIAVWFEVELADGIRFSTSPEQACCSWEQAVFPIIFEKRVLKNEQISLLVTVRDNWLLCNINESIENTSALIQLEPRSVAMMNDERLTSFYESANDPIFGDSSVLDISGNPQLALKLAPKFQNYIIRETEEIKKFAPFHQSNVKIVAEAELESLQESIATSIASLIVNPTDSGGQLKPNCLEDIAYFRLKYDGIKRVIPSGLKIMGQLIESEDLCANCRILDDSRTLGLDIGRYLHYFEPQIHRDIEFSTLKHQKLSEPLEIFALNFDESMPGNGKSPKFVDSKKQISVNITAPSGTIHALMIWFEYHDGDRHFSTLEDGHFFQSAHILKSMKVCQGETVILHCCLYRSSLEIQILQL